MRRTRAISTVLLGASLLLVSSCASSPGEDAAGASVTAYEGATVIVGDGGAPIEDAVFTIDGDRFLQVGGRGDVDVPDGARRVDLTGRTVMPAIVDTHTHLSRERAALIEDLQRRGYYGVGAALSLGQDTGDLPLQMREETIPNAARFRTAGRGITAPEPGRSDIPYWVTSPEQARMAVQEQAERQVDLLKIWVDDRNGKYEKLTPELYGAIIDEAHQRGIRVTAHIYALEDAKGLLRAGIDAFAHGVRDRDVDDEFVAMMKERPDVVLVPNLPDRGVAADLSWLRDSIPAGELQELQAGTTDRPQVQQAFAIQARNLERLSREGVRIALGSDGNTPWAPHVEMADMVAAGMMPADVIVAATRNSAVFIGLEDTGTIEEGQVADFIVLEASPLDDITNTRRIVDVYLRGTAVNRDALRAGWMDAAE